jgi:DnaJ-domain-containing protein 1
MRNSRAKCLQCGSRWRASDLDSQYENLLGTDGSFLGTGYWFCSVECFKKAVGEHLDDNKYDFDKRPEDDPEFVRWARLMGRGYGLGDWKFRQRSAIYEAAFGLHERLSAFDFLLPFALGVADLEQEAERRRWQAQQEREAERRRLQAEEKLEAERQREKEREQAARETSQQDDVWWSVLEDDVWWSVLGISPDAGKDEIRRTYYLKMHQCHPDKVFGLGPEFIEMAEARTKALNAAYQQAMQALASNARR